MQQNCSVLLHEDFYTKSPTCAKKQKRREENKGRIVAFYLSTQNVASNLYALYLIMSFKITKQELKVDYIEKYIVTKVPHFRNIVPN